METSSTHRRRLSIWGQVRNLHSTLSTQHRISLSLSLPFNQHRNQQTVFQPTLDHKIFSIFCLKRGKCTFPPLKICSLCIEALLKFCFLRSARFQIQIHQDEMVVRGALFLTRCCTCALSDLG